MIHLFFDLIAGWASDFSHWIVKAENASLAVSAFALAVSVFTLARDMLGNRERYTIEIIDYSQPLHCIQLLISITNRSGSPLILTHFSLLGICCELEPKRIRGRAENFGFQSTPVFPLCISAHGACYAYLEFVYDSPPQIDLSAGKDLTLQIHSTRRQARRTIQLGSKSHYLHSRE